MSRMTGRIPRRVALYGACIAVFVTSLGSPATATGPQVTLDRSVVNPGEPVIVTFQGFDSRFVNITLCGNLARRGSTDCNMTSSISKETNVSSRPRIIQLIANPPPAPCPCIVRVSASDGGSFALAPISIVGHPEGPLVDVDLGPLVDVEVEAVRAPAGVLGAVRSSLGGPTRYEIEVSVRNTSNTPISDLQLRGSAGNWLHDDASTLRIQGPEILQPGATTTERVTVEVPAPALGKYRFEVVAFGAGESVTAAATAGNIPVMLALLVVVFVADVVVMAWRYARNPLRGQDRRVRRRSDLPVPDGTSAVI